MTVSASLPTDLATWRDPARWSRACDIVAVLLALSLPWSTSLVGIFGAVFVLTMAPTIEWRSFKESLQRPFSVLPIALFALAVVGVSWSDAPWGARIYAIDPLAKLLVLPLLVYHFERSERGQGVLLAFLVSCSLLMVLSWVVVVFPFTPISRSQMGVPLKNYIDQSQEFTLCLFALASLALQFVRQRRFALAAGCGLLMLGFFADMMFVVSARTALVYMPVLLVLFGMMHLNWRASLMLIAGAFVVLLIVWFTSPYLRQRVETVGHEYRLYQNDKSVVQSTGERLEYWRKSLKFIGTAPIFGNGTGATKTLFEQDAVGKSGLAAVVIGNPHNQTLNVAVQWGLLGVVILYAMWLSHLLLFRGERVAANIAGWVGLLTVVQNVVSSLLNSHLFDFHEGWMYVLGVGVTGGMMLAQRKRAALREGESYR